MARNIAPLQWDLLESTPDPSTDWRLLPEALRPRDNSMRLRYCKRALENAIDDCLSPVQQAYVRLYYWQGLRKSEIASMHGVSCSTVSKAVKAAEKLLRDYIDLYLRIYDELVVDLLSDTEHQ